MSLWGAVAGGFAGTVVLTTALAGASQFGLTRIDIPFLLGTAFTANRVLAKAIGYVLHFLFGMAFALVYAWIFAVLGEHRWWIGLLLGIGQALFVGTVVVNGMLPLVHPRMATPLTAADSAPLLEAPGFMLLNYGTQTPIVTLLAHMAYGAIVGIFLALSMR